MIQLTPHMRILVSIQPVDMRKQIDGLCGYCREILQENPYSGAVFVFTSRSRKMINWMYMGTTGGRKKRGHRYEHQWAPKAVYLYPLHRRFREILVGG